MVNSGLFLNFKVLFVRCFFIGQPTETVLSLCFIPDGAEAEDKPELNGNQQDNGAVQGTRTNTHKQQ